ncbi:MAG: hypothetical protein M3527_05315, partial [Actinomycetota bacterium]|nr:hypothetical protein [Actinomycetota bacterium]
APAVAPPPAAAVAAPPIVPSGRFTLEPYAGLGAWLDVYDWSATYTNGNPPAGLPDIDRMASLGVRTLYIQASKWDSPTPVLEEERLRPLIDRAHELGMRVVVWYLPTLLDPGADLYRLVSIAALPVDGIAVDIEGRNLADVAERNRRLVQLSADLRAHLPGQVISAVPVPPVVMEDINPNFWPGFPWAELAPYYDVWQPMSYWSNRLASSGWRDGYAYTAANIDRIRAHIGQPNAPVHSIGGIGDAVSVEQIAAMLQASYERGALGGSIYDYRTTGPEHWPVLQRFNG